MTMLLRDVIDRVKQWPEDRQDEAAQVLLDLEAQQEGRYRLTPDQADEVRRIQRQVRNGTARFATDGEMAAFWKKCGV